MSAEDFPPSFPPPRPPRLSGQYISAIVEKYEGRTTPQHVAHSSATTSLKSDYCTFEVI